MAGESRSGAHFVSRTIILFRLRKSVSFFWQGDGIMADNENNENNENEKEYVKALPTDAEIDELLRECTEAEFI